MLALRPERLWRAGLSATVAVLLTTIAACAAPPFARQSAGVSRPAPALSRADLFMRSVEVRDGALGWRQLCPDVQSQIPESAVMSAASAQKAAEAGQVRSLRSELLGMRKLDSGEQLRLYLLTAHLVGGAEARRVYVLQTSADGCVRDVQTEVVR
jgi:hypothetical protein